MYLNGVIVKVLIITDITASTQAYLTYEDWFTLLHLHSYPIVTGGQYGGK